MSILGAETTLYPETLLEPAGPRTSDRQWMVVYTKARQEKALARDLLHREIPFYLPVVKRTCLYRGRKRARYLPLFAGYVFLYGSEAERIGSLTTNHISRLLSVPDPEQLVRELRDLRQLIAAKAPLTVESRLAGRRCARAAGAVCRHRGDGAGPPRRDAAAGEHQFSPARGVGRDRRLPARAHRLSGRSGRRALAAGKRVGVPQGGTVPNLFLGPQARSLSCRRLISRGGGRRACCRRATQALRNCPLPERRGAASGRPMFSCLNSK